MANTIKIAVVGIGLNYPGARGGREFWELLCSGRDVSGPIPAGRWAPGNYDLPGQGYFINNYPGFDPKSFGLKPNVARQMDPMQWLALDTARAALEDGGISPDFLANHPCGNWCGVNSSDSYAPVFELNPAAYTPHTSFGCCQSMISGWLSYCLNLTGPAITINSACSSSLNAIIMATQALQCGQVDLALAGGVHLYSSPTSALIRNRTGLLSPDGICYSYDERGNGYALGEGCGFVLLEELSAAKKHGHHIYGLIHSYAQAHTGNSGGLGTSQAGTISHCMEEALSRGGLTIDDLAFVEGHGTGTVNGDSAELAAIAQLAQNRKNPLWLSSVKSHLGHQDAAAGVTGLLTALLELGRRQLIPTMHFEKMRPISGGAAKLAIPRSAVRLPGTAGCAAVNAVGFNGTVATVIIKKWGRGCPDLPELPPAPVTKYRLEKAPGADRPAAAAVTEVPAAHDDKIRALILQELKKACGFDDLDEKSNLLDLGLDSLALFEVGAEIKDKYGIALTPTVLITCRTVGDVLAIGDRL